MILEIPRVPPSPNLLRGLHWRHRYRNSQLWRQEIFYAVREAGCPSEPYPRAQVSIDRRSKGFLDPDNLYGSVKPVIDALRYAHVLVDDSPKHIELIVTQTRGKPLTTIKVEPYC